MTDMLMGVTIIGMILIAVTVDLGTIVIWIARRIRARRSRRRSEIEKGAADEHHATLRACRRDEVMIL